MPSGARSLPFFIAFDTFDTGVRDFEYAFSTLMSDAVYGLRAGRFFVFFATCALL